MGIMSINTKIGGVMEEIIKKRIKTLTVTMCDLGESGNLDTKTEKICRAKIELLHSILDEYKKAKVAN